MFSRRFRLRSHLWRGLKGHGGDLVAEPFPTTALRVEDAHTRALAAGIKDGEETAQMAGMAQRCTADTWQFGLPQAARVGAPLRRRLQFCQGLCLHEAWLA